MELESDDRQTHVAVAGSLDLASSFFAGGALGYSVTGAPDRFDGLELRCAHWEVEPVAVEHVASSVFDDRNRFPEQAIAFACALLMRNIPHRRYGRGRLQTG